MVGIAQACSVSYTSGGDVMILENIIPPGLGADCNVTTYENITLIDTAWMTENGLAYTHTIYNLSPGIYSSGIYCNLTYNATVTNIFEGECKFEVKEDGNMIIAFLAGIFIICGALLYIAFGLEKVHGILKLLFLTITIILQIFTGRLIMLAAEGTKYEALSGTLYTTIIWLIRFWVIYLFLYLIYTWLDMMGKIPKGFSLRGENG